MLRYTEDIKRQNSLTANKLTNSNLTKECDYMKKLIALVLSLVCVLGLVGCVDNQQNISEKDKNQLIYGETQEPSDNDIIHGEGGQLGPTK